MEIASPRRKYIKILLFLILLILGFIAGVLVNYGSITVTKIDFHEDGRNSVTCRNLSHKSFIQVDNFQDATKIGFHSDTSNIEMNFPKQTETHRDWQTISEQNWGKQIKFETYFENGGATHATWKWQGMTFSAFFDDHGRLTSLTCGH